MEPLSNMFQKGDSPYLYGYPPSPPLVYPITSNSQAVGEAQKPRVLLFSLRNVDRAIFRGSLYEFEDVIMSVDAVRLLSPHQEPGAGRKLYRSLETKVRARLGMFQRPNLIPTRVDEEYGLFFTVFHFARDVGYLDQIKDWRRGSHFQSLLRGHRRRTGDPRQLPGL